MATSAAVLAHRIRATFIHKPTAVGPRFSFARLAISEQRRYNSLHLGRSAHIRRNVSYTANPDVQELGGAISSPGAIMSKRAGALSILPWSWLIRSYFITSISSFPPLLRISLRALKFLVNSKSPFLNPDRNPIIHFLLKKTVYSQFCAGENAAEVDNTITRLKAIGFKGVMLCYAREISSGEGNHTSSNSDTAQDETSTSQISGWAKGILDTVNMAQSGDFVPLKLSGAGAQVVDQLAQCKAPPPMMEKVLTEVCELAKARGVRLQIDAEHENILAGLEAWTLEYMKRYNRQQEALIYCTYQAYRKSTPATLAEHLQAALDGNFTLGIKLVRGAYLWSDPRWLFWDTIEDTHKTYDGIAESVIRRTYNETLKPRSAAQQKYPAVCLVLAGHNAKSVQKAQEIRNAQAAARAPRIQVAHGQLMGMAENISCELVHAGQLNGKVGEDDAIDIPQAYQYLSWGSVGECSQYLVRRAEENQDAASRTKDTRNALGKEVLRRLGIHLR